MLRNLKLLLPLLLLFLGFWYFFLKEYDYTIRFDVQTSKGHIYQKLQAWKYKNLAQVTVADQKAFHKLQQTSKDITLDWKINAKNDTLSRVSVGVNHKQNKIRKRFELMLGQTEFQEEIKAEIRSFKEALEADKNLTKFSIGNQEKIKESTCACIRLESKSEEKAYEMMGNIGYLSDYLLENNLEMAGKPRVHITKWDKEENYINFDFCFPLEGEQDFPETPLIFIKTIPGFKAVKGNYQGNYMFTHYFWPQLLQANSNDKEIEILEIFKDNPEMGGDATHWEAELYLIEN